MNKYEVTCTKIVNYIVTVEAHNEDDAMGKARELEEEKLIAVGGELTVDFAEQLPEEE